MLRVFYDFRRFSPALKRTEEQNGGIEGKTRSNDRGNYEHVVAARVFLSGAGGRA